MGKRIYITESQVNYLISQEALLNEGVSEIINLIKSGKLSTSAIKDLVKKGLITASLAVAVMQGIDGLTANAVESPEPDSAIENVADDWVLAADDVVVTVYNAVKEQCNSDPSLTASMFKINLDDPASHRIVALERTFRKELGLEYGDVIKIEGTYRGKQDGIYRVEDTMNKRFAGQHKVDVLVDNDIRYGGTTPDKPAKLYILRDPSKTSHYINQMAPEASK